MAGADFILMLEWPEPPANDFQGCCFSLPKRVRTSPGRDSCKLIRFELVACCARVRCRWCSPRRGKRAVRRGKDENRDHDGERNCSTLILRHPPLPAGTEHLCYRRKRCAWNRASRSRLGRDGETANIPSVNFPERMRLYCNCSGWTMMDTGIQNRAGT